MEKLNELINYEAWVSSYFFTYHIRSQQPKIYYLKVDSNRKLQGQVIVTTQNII